MPGARCRVALGGTVQGVGFRPWAAQRARALGLAGGVRNTGSGAEVVLDGDRSAIDAWLAALRADAPGRIESLDLCWERPRGEREFVIGASDVSSASLASRIPPDAAVCGDCLRELFDPEDRRHRHAFCHCARCGPRASILRALPFDRERTSLAAFALCTECRGEYEDPGDRRCHAETIACASCGPSLAARASGLIAIGT